MISYFNALRPRGSVERSDCAGSRQTGPAGDDYRHDGHPRFLPAALSTKIGSQTQKPLAIVVVGGMTLTLFLDRYLMPVLYSFYGHREPPAGGGSMANSVKRRKEAQIAKSTKFDNR